MNKILEWDHSVIFKSSICLFLLKKLIISLRFWWEIYSSAVKERKIRIIKFHSDGIHFSFRKYKAVRGIAEQAMIWLVENNNSKPVCPLRQTGEGLWVHFPNSSCYYRALSASQSSHIENCTINQNCQARSVYSYCVAKFFCRLAICFVLREIFFAISADWFFSLGINVCDFDNVFAFHSYFQTILQCVYPM